jgi:hypothetical protein
MIKEIKDPEENCIKVMTTSVLISRDDSEKQSDNVHPTAVLRLFNINNPHKRHNVFPTHVFRFTNIEKVRPMRLNFSFYLAGDDIVINDLEELYILHEGTKIILKGYQHEVERRNPDEEKVNACMRH